MTRLPPDFPPLAEMAGRAAREWSDLWVRVRAERGDMGPWLGWDHADNADQRETETAVQAALLSDLTRPESQTLWLRWLAERVGVPAPVVGAPAWTADPLLGGVFLLWDGAWCGAFAFGAEAYGSSESHFDEIDVRCTRCPALSSPGAPDAPIRALVLAVLTVGGAA